MKHRILIFILAAISCVSCYAQISSEKFPVVTADTVDTKAQFPGGSAVWSKYLQRNLNAAVTAFDKSPAGNYPVTVEFYVDKDGNVSNVNAVSNPALCPSCGPEAVRVIKAGPKWIPATKDGKAVAYKTMQKITFQVATNTAFYPPPVGPVLMPFRGITLTEALEEAGKTGKMVFAQFIVSGCERCNETAESAFASKKLAEAVTNKCIPIKIEISSPDRGDFVRKYNPANQLGTFFISADGELLSHYARTSSRADEYLVELEKAYSKLMEGRVTLKELDEEWKANPQNFVAMEMNLERRQGFGWHTDVLLDVYVQRLPPDSQRSTRTLAFIATMAPSLFSRANATLRRDDQLFDKAWSTLPVAKRVDINKRLIAKSLSRAIAAKNMGMAETVAVFTKNTYNTSSPSEAQQGYDKQMMQFFKGIRDTATYLQKAVAFYDTYYMSVDPMHILTLDSINRKKAFDTAQTIRVEDPNHKGKFYNRRNITIIPQGTLLASELLQGAQSFYTLTNQQDYLEKAVSWATRANQLYPFADLDGVLPRLLYVLGRKTLAISLQKELVKRAQMARGKSITQQSTLELMEAGGKLKDGFERER